MTCDSDPAEYATPIKSEAANRIRPFTRETGVKGAITPQTIAMMENTRTSTLINIPVDCSFAGHPDLGYAFVLPRFLRIESPRISIR
jgi:hypothetical protein